MKSFQLIIIPLVVAIITQVLKLSIDSIKGNLNLKNIFISYGGMPSAHTALVVSVTTLVGIQQGLSSSLFAVSLIFTIIIMRDAVTFRNILGNQGKLLNQLVSNLPKIQRKNMPSFMERIGHSLSEVIIGAIWGAGSTFIIYTLVNYS